MWFFGIIFFTKRATKAQSFRTTQTDNVSKYLKPSTNCEPLVKMTVDLTFVFTFDLAQLQAYLKKISLGKQA